MSNSIDPIDPIEMAAICARDTARHRVDCIIPCYNNAGTAVDAVMSVLAQDVDDMGVIIVNDGSTDGSEHVLGTIRDPRVTIISQINRGPAAARNCGIQASRAEYYAFLDADDLWLPGKLRFQIEALEALAQATGNAAIGHCVSFRQVRQGGTGTGNDRIMPAPDLFREALLDVCMTTIGSTLLVRRSVFEAVGLFNEDLRCFEDWEWQLRCLLNGFRFDTSQRVLVVKHEGGRRRSGPAVENACRQLRRIVPEIAVAWGSGPARRLASALSFEMAVSHFLRREWAGCARELAASLQNNPRRLTYMARRLLQRAGIAFGRG